MIFIDFKIVEQTNEKGGNDFHLKIQRNCGKHCEGFHSIMVS